MSNETKTLVKTNGNGDIKTVVYNIYGKETTEGLIDVEYQYEDIKVTGVIGKPEIARNNRSYQLFFVNKRFIKDKTLSAGAEQAYKGLLPIGKFGFIILNLDMDPRKIDVNVHPTKLEIRFQEEQKVFKAVYHAIKEALLKGDLVKNPDKESEEERREEKDTQEEMKISNPENLISNTPSVNMQATQRFETIKEDEAETPKKVGLFGIFKKKNNYKLNLIIIISSTVVIALGVALTFYKIYHTQEVQDVSDKYSMTSVYDKLDLPKDESKKFYITFNANYKNDYVIEYDENLKDQIKLEVKYYENYYDYYIKKSNNNVYISLKIDDRDRISSYISDFKEGKIYSTDELSRYTIKITINENDKDRLEIIH